MPHGQYVGYDPYNKWVKPSCVLICEDDYSNGRDRQLEATIKEMMKK